MIDTSDFRNGLSIIQDNIEAATCSNDKLLKLAVRMPPTRCSTGHIIQIVDPFYFKRNR